MELKTWVNKAKTVSKSKPLVAVCNCSLYQCFLQALHNYHYITALPLTYFTLHTTKLSNWTVNMNSFSLRNSRMKCVLSNVVVFTYSYLKSVLLSLCKIVLYTVTIPIKIFLFNRMSSWFPYVNEFIQMKEPVKT